MSLFDIKMPKLGESITEGTILTWNVKVGDTVEEDDILFEVNTAKVSAEIPSPVAGVVKEILHVEGDTVAVGNIVARIDLSGEAVVGEESKAAAPAEEAKSASSQSESPKAEKPAKKSGDRWYSPVVLQKAKEGKVSAEELDAIQGTGFEGRVSKHDIIAFIEKKKGAPAPSLTKPSTPAAPVAAAPQKAAPSVPVVAGPEDTVIPMDPVRRIIADRMTESKHISPHVTNVIEVDVTNLVRWRDREKEAFKKREGISLTFMAPILEATAKALKDYPRVNSSVDGYNIIERKSINIGMAVSLPDGNLIVPVIKNADRMSISGLANEVSALANKARANKLGMDEIQGGTFTISNFGSFKSLFGTPIINQPEVAILGVGTIEKKPSILETPDGPVMAIRDKMYLALSYDHRVIDGMLGGNFLYRIGQYLEEWNA
ncbi:dihydrolipoamide acetyltransferase family protein [Porphyromonas canoris]|uniref:Dihydrolipoamide acetyltransferase component of pyruvate dehydrogenase complex n=1 Tax=Porphyromonas canoris TaxID=36875 RepID=A0ABR4XK60_9PORP|nr:dihydrolipoamide acetyltransferase family protein [Porphyromonas canoris]KGN91859.1 diapophytoene dehydrogenase [Porphyromonas canoris]